MDKRDYIYNPKEFRRPRFRPRSVVHAPSNQPEYHKLPSRKLVLLLGFVSGILFTLVMQGRI